MPEPRRDRYPGTLLAIVFCLLLTQNSQSLLYDYIFQINPSVSQPTDILSIAFNRTSSTVQSVPTSGPWSGQ